MNEWLAVAPQATAAHGQTGCMVSLNDFADRTPRALTGRRGDRHRRRQARPLHRHAAHPAWLGRRRALRGVDRTLLCGDLFTQLGNDRALTAGDIVGPAIAAEDVFNYSSLNPGMGATIRGLAALAPRTLALMHGPSFTGDGAAALRAPGG